MSAVIRTFFAIDLTWEAKQKIAELIEKLKAAQSPSIRWIPTESLHITLAFIGNMKLEEVNTLVIRIKNAIQTNKCFNLKLAELQSFPNETHPHTIVLTPSPSKLLSELAKAIKDEVTAAGYPLEKRPFRPHLTLGRIKKSKDILPLPAIQPFLLEVNNITLFQSIGHSYYIPLAVLPLI